MRAQGGERRLAGPEKSFFSGKIRDLKADGGNRAPQIISRHFSEKIGRAIDGIARILGKVRPEGGGSCCEPIKKDLQCRKG